MGAAERGADRLRDENARDPANASDRQVFFHEHLLTGDVAAQRRERRAKSRRNRVAANVQTPPVFSRMYYSAKNHSVLAEQGLCPWSFPGG